MSMLAILSFSFAAAVLCANYLPLEGVLLPLGCAFVLAFAVTFLPRLRQMPRNRKARYAAFGLALGCLWTVGYSQVFWAPAQALDEKTVRLTATVSQWPQETDYGGVSVLARADTEGWVTVPILLYVDEQGSDLRPGDRIETVVHCTLADQTSTGEEITYYTAKGIFLTGQAYGRLEVEQPDHIPLRDRPAYWSQALKESIAQTFPGDVSGLVQALVTGNRDSLTDPFTTSHIPALAQMLTGAGLSEFANIPIFAGYTLQNLPYVLFVSVGVAGIGFCCYFLAMEYQPASVVSLVYFFKPALAPVLAWMVHGEIIAPNMLLGIVLIVAGSLCAIIPGILEAKRVSLQK